MLGRGGGRRSRGSSSNYSSESIGNDSWNSLFQRSHFWMIPRNPFWEHALYAAFAPSISSENGNLRKERFWRAIISPFSSNALMSCPNTIELSTFCPLWSFGRLMGRVPAFSMRKEENVPRWNWVSFAVNLKSERFYFALRRSDLVSTHPEHV